MLATTIALLELRNEGKVGMRVGGRPLGQIQQRLAKIRLGVQRLWIRLEQHAKLFRRTVTTHGNMNGQPSLLVLEEHSVGSTVNHHACQTGRNVVRKRNVKGCTTSHATRSNETFWVGRNQQMNQSFLRSRVHLGVALTNDMEGDRSIAIPNGGCLGRRGENVGNDSSSMFRVGLAGNGLVYNRRGNVIAHGHVRCGDQWVLLYESQDLCPLVGGATEFEDLVHCVATWLRLHGGWCCCWGREQESELKSTSLLYMHLNL